MGDGDLTYVDITALAQIISKGDMESIALGYFEQDWNRVRTHKDDLRSTAEFNRNFDGLEESQSWCEPEKGELCARFSKRSLEKGSVFTHVCHSVHKGRDPCMKPYVLWGEGVLCAWPMFLAPLSLGESLSKGSSSTGSL